MTRTRVFFAALSLGVTIVFALHSQFPVTDPFLILPKDRILTLDGYTRPQIADMKLQHAFASRKYDVGIFGNSRSLRVGDRDMTLGKCRFYNFSVHGTSYRNSLIMLEALADARKAPDLAIVTFDNFVIQMFRNPVDLPMMLRWKAVYKDIKSAIAEPGINLRERLRMVWRPLQGEGELFTTAFKFDTLRALWDKAAYSLKPTKLIADKTSGYTREGTRIRPAPKPDFVVNDIQPLSLMSASLGYLSLDLKRFHDLQARGIKIVLYESLLEPKSADYYAQYPSAAAEITRRAFIRGCAAEGLNCPIAPSRLPGPAYPWFDPTHPDPKSLGLYFNPLIAAASPACLSK